MPSRPSRPLYGLVAVWCVGVALAVKAAVVHHDFLWATGGFAVASAAAAHLAAVRRREGWAFAGSLAVHGAVTAAVWYAHDGVPLSSWAVTLAQANLLAAGVTAWLWLTP